MFFIVILSSLFALEAIVFVTFRRFLKRMNLKGRLWDWISIAPFIFFLIPFIYPLIYRNNFTRLPEPLYDFLILPFYIFHGAVFFIGIVLLVGNVVKSPFAATHYWLNRIKATKVKLDKLKRKRSVQKFDRSRRRFLTASTAAVSGYAFVSAGMGVLAKDNYEIVEKELKINNLPPELKGTTVTLITDIHSGPYMETPLMKDYVDVINSLQSDVIMISGDLTNSDRNEAKPFAASFRDLKAKYGVYATLGNHDYFSDANYVAEVVLKDTPIKLLRNETELIKINNKEICLLGVEDTRQSGSVYDPVIMGYVDETVRKAKALSASQNLVYETLPKILLYHKPYFFKELAPQKFDLILSGHTHGGQVVLAKLGDFNLSIAASVSPYLSGLYKHENSQMYVSRGLGVVALPIRLNCRPEITKFTLV